MAKLPPPPFELYTGQTGGFIGFDDGNELISLPLHTLASLSLRGSGSPQQLTLEFANHLVQIKGANLSTIVNHIEVGRVRRIRSGQAEDSKVESATVLEM